MTPARYCELRELSYRNLGTGFVQLSEALDTIEESAARISALEEGLRKLVDWMDIGGNERFEMLAAAYQEETGSLAPGKDGTPYNYVSLGDNEIARNQRAFCDFQTRFFDDIAKSVRPASPRAGETP
jgi:hypothetical protein